MEFDLTFREVCKFLKEDDPKLIEKVDLLLGLVLILSPVALASYPAAAASLLGLLSTKNELTKIGKSLFERITAKKDKDSLAKQRRMEMAYCLICYTAFFEAIDVLFPEIKKSVGLNASEKLCLSESALARLRAKYSSDDKSIKLPKVDIQDRQVSLPHPVESFNQHKRRLIAFYEELTQGFFTFLEGLAFWESSEELTQRRVMEIAKKLPQISFDYFEAQYFQLAAKYEEFYIWANLHEHKRTRAQLRKMSASLQSRIALSRAEKSTIDIGFKTLAETIKSLAIYVETGKANKVLEELGRYYKELINQPIVEDSYVPEEGKPTLKYPKRADIFIPQSFKTIRYTGNEHLEKETTWQKIKMRNDLGSFLLSYFSSPYSTRTPLIILGHPGSGKSLLTQVLAARLFSPLHNPVRVELRDIQAENEITVQIEEQIHKDTGRTVQWTELTDHPSNRPDLVLFDGYDELLQASGKVFSGYLLKAQKFQEREISLGRNPIRVVVTSRITLINKAQLPHGATVILLQEFDDSKRKKWISVWNSINQEYFEHAQIYPFELPVGNSKVMSLAGQPLLLLMLALYDSEDNQLRKKGNLDQTVLYSSLLRRFIERERTKDETFKFLTSKERDYDIEREMERLGVASIGMFNRRRLHIRATQLNSDIRFFQLEKTLEASDGRPLSQADLLLGSFFFVHESRSTHKAESMTDREGDSAFEFLHNTFGEFLTADFIIRKVLAETRILHKLRLDEDLHPTLLRKLEDANALPDAWFACLMYTPLYSRPVILAMMREWLGHRLNYENRSYKDFLLDFDCIVSNQIDRILTSNDLPIVMTKSNKTPFIDVPLKGHLAIYSLNLVLLRAVLSPEEYMFDETSIPHHADGTRAWDRLTHLWRSWFSLDSLGGLTAIWSAKRDGSKIVLNSKESFSIPLSKSRRASILHLSLALADNITSSLGGLLSYDSLEDNIIELSDIAKFADSENLEINVEVIIKRLKYLSGKISAYPERQKILQECLAWFGRIQWVELGTVIDLLRLVKETGDRIFLVRFLSIFIQRVSIQAIIKESPNVALEVFRLANETDSEDIVRKISAAFLEYITSIPLQDIPPPFLVEALKLINNTSSLKDPEGFFNEYPDRQLQDLEDLPVGAAIEDFRLMTRAKKGTVDKDERRSTFIRFSGACLEHFSAAALQRNAPAELVVRAIELADVTGSRSFLERLTGHFFEHIWDPCLLWKVEPKILVKRNDQ